MTEIHRRRFLTSALAALGLSATARRDGVAAFTQPAAGAEAQRIDIHHHFAPPAWVAEVKGRPLLQTANTTWTPEKSIDDLDRAGSAAAVISITNPGLWFGDNQTTNRIARACNEYGAKLVQQYPTRFGLLAAMPLPDIDATLKEIAYAYDVLKVDGVGLFTSYGDTWLGNAAFRPVMAELNRRKAVVHVHPTAANCCRNLDYGTAPGSIEYGTDTTRAIIGVTFNGDTTRYPDITFIWSHGGGSAPFLAGRIDGGSRNAKDRMPAGFIAEAKKFFYDTAGAANRGAIASLLELVGPPHVLFGTDFPPGGTNLAVAKALADLGFFKDADLRAIERDNAIRLLPRLKASAA
jgi:predicted TIM-barrel fold metal-dependent hydrolase